MIELEIHPSSLPTFIDCEMRWAASNLKEVREKCTKRDRFVGAVFGTVAHEHIAEMLKDKMITGEVPRPDKYLLDSCKSLDREFADLKKPIKTDDTTSTVMQAKVQMERVLREAWYSVVRGANPRVVEEEYKIEITNKAGILINMLMKPDMVRMEPIISDHKFPRQLGDYKAQGGGYIIGWEAMNRGEFIELFELLCISRVGVKSVPAVLQPVLYSREQCLEPARAAIKAIISKVPEFYETGKSKVFRKNPNSKFCTRTTCGAWGTDQCNQWTDLKGELKKDGRN